MQNLAREAYHAANNIDNFSFKYGTFLIAMP